MRWVWLTLVVVVAVVATAFTIQNSAFKAPLQLDLWFAAWKLSSPVEVPVLMWVAFGSGLLLGGGVAGIRSVALGRKVRKLEQELAMGTVKAKDPWAG